MRTITVLETQQGKIETVIDTQDLPILPTLITNAGDLAAYRFIEFFTANIRNPNTRKAYYFAVNRFMNWCAIQELSLTTIRSLHVASYIEVLGNKVSAPTVKQHLSAIRMLFDFLVTGQIVGENPAAAVRGPKHVVKKGKTPVLTAQETRELLDAIDTSKIAGLRDRALIGVLVFSFSRVSATVGMNVEDYFKQQGRTMWLRLHEKGGKYHEVPAHHKAVEYLDAYLDEAGIWNNKTGPLFRSLNRKRQLTQRRLHRREVLAMVQRRARQAGLQDNISCHTLRATGITTYLQNGGTIENAQQIAAHESPKTTKLYDRTSDEISLDEVERIII